MIKSPSRPCGGCDAILSAKGGECPICHYCRECCERWDLTGSCIENFLCLSPAEQREAITALEGERDRLMDRNRQRREPLLQMEGVQHVDTHEAGR